MQWNSLLSNQRLGDPGTKPQPEVRNDFQRDFDRIIFSTAFRRMHGKTQVFPLPRSDVTHTRLTHSLEASCVARSLGSIVAQQLPELDSGSISSIVAAAALAHDIGNPPFGHSGEAAISDFFASSKGQLYLRGLSEAKRQDFLRFEGNALGLRLLTRTRPHQSSWSGGLQLTRATLGAFTKYPKASSPLGRKDRASEKKFGYFQSESAVFAEVAESLGLVQRPGYGWCRHPLAFLMEAADDICYGIMDLEDGCRESLVPQEEAEHLLLAIASLPPSPSRRDTLGGIFDPKERIAYLRAKSINNLVLQAAAVFVGNLQGLLDGEYDSALVESTEGAAALAAVRNATKRYIYPHRPVVGIEAAGFRILGGLVEDFLAASWEHPVSKRNAKVLSLVGQEYLTPREADQHEAVMGIVEYVANMTDDFAISTYRVLRGIELPMT